MSTLFSTFAALVLLAQSSPVSAPQAVQTLRQAWSSGELASANMYAMTAMDSVQQNGCAVSPMAASLLFYAAVSDQVCQCESIEGYSFWAALEIDSRVGGLTAAQREIAEQFARQPGENRSDDWAFAQSPYLASRISEQGVCDDLHLEPLASPPNGVGEVAFFYTRVRLRPNNRVFRVLPVMSYPTGEEREIGEVVTGYRAYVDHRNEILFYRFTPCRTMGTPDFGSETVCRSDWIEAGAPSSAP